MKDCVSIKMPDGTKEKVQKRFLLANILEIYTLFKSEHPDVKIGFSSFALLGPKWCIPVGAAGTHNVCVCTYHQNVKLMLSTVDRSLNYREVLKLCVCDVSNPDCMLNHCDSCPHESVIKLFLVDKLLMKYSRDSTINFSQWISTDRSQLEENECDFDEFIEKLTTMFYKLTEHHYIAKSQSAYFKHRKASLTSDECVIVLDFAENYAFIVQDAAQSFHWNNSQATIHPFVMYYQDIDTGSIHHKTYACISDHMTHDTNAVYTFLKRLLVDFVKPDFPTMKKVIYFSDGSAAQYKNYKNLTNLIFHDRDFDLQAEWHFFATSHGKNACDGVGGTIKRLAARGSLQRTNICILGIMYAF